MRTRYTIHGETWRVKYGSPPDDPLFSGKNRRMLGWCLYEEREIRLHPKLRLKKNRRERDITIAHELLHAYCPRMKHRTISWFEKPFASLLSENFL
jgi:hypothetical protein